MLFRLAHTGACLWLLGLSGMYVSRAFFDLDPDSIPFALCASVWLAGGISYAALGLLGHLCRR